MLQQTKKKKLYLSVGAIVLVLALILGISLNPSSGSAQARNSLATATVTQGDITQTVTATGHLATSGGVNFHIPANLQIDTVYVQAGDIVTYGQALLRFDLASIHSQIAHVQEELNRLDSEIADIQAQSTSRTITAGVSGHLEEVFAQTGDLVTETMIAHGALAHIVIDGLEAPIAITGTTGEVVRVHLSPGASVSPNTVLFTLEAMETLPAHSALFTERSEHAAILSELISLSQTGVLTAPFHGIIEAVMVGDNPSAPSGGPSMPSIPSGFPPMFMGMSSAPTTDAAATLVRVSYAEDFPVETPPDTQPPSINVVEITTLESLSFSAPVVGASPQTNLSATGFTATVQWLPEHTAFAPGTIYRAMVLLEPNEGYLFGQGVADELANGIFPAQDATIIGVEPFGHAIAVAISFPATPGDPPGGAFPGLPPGLLPEFPSFPSLPSFNLPSFSMPSMPSMDMGSLGGSANPNLSVPAFFIAAGDVMELRVNIDERDILSLAVGQTAEILLDALPGTTFYGEISRINVSGQSSGGSARYTVELLLPRAPQMLPSMSASAVIITHVAENVLLLPVQSIQEIAGREFVFLSETSAGVPADEQNILTGISDGLMVEIISGLELGTTVFYEQRGGFSFPHWGPGPGWGGSSN